MKLTILTLFPDILRGYFVNSIMARAALRGLVSYDLVNIRDFAYDKHRVCDAAPYGGGAGMVLRPEPLARALDSVDGNVKRVIFPTPSGRLFTQRCAAELADQDELVLICGRYEGIDQRIIDLYVDDEISIGDFVISSGEVAVMVIVDAVYRLLDGVISTESLAEESFVNSLLEYPHYTRPEEFRGLRVPEVLQSGHHARIAAWRHAKCVEKTLANRPELIGQDESKGNDHGSDKSC